MNTINNLLTPITTVHLNTPLTPLNNLFKAKVGFEALDDGMFWICIEDWLGAYESLYWNSEQQLSALGRVYDWKEGKEKKLFLIQERETERETPLPFRLLYSV